MKENIDVEYENAEDVGRAEYVEDELREDPNDKITENIHNIAGVLSTEEKKSQEKSYVFFIIAGIIVAIILLGYIFTNY